MSQEVGRCHISIFGDDSPYRRKVAALGRGTAAAARIRVDADVRKARTDVNKLRSTLSSLSSESVRVDVSTEQGMRAAKDLRRELQNVARRAYRASLTVEDAKARAQLRGIRAAALIAARRIELRVEAETGRAMGELSTLKAFLSAIGDKRIRVTADTRPAVAAAAALNEGLDAGSRAIQRFNNSVRTLGNVGRVAARVGILGLVGALAPLAGIAGIAGAGLTAVAGGIGLLAATAIPSITALTNHKTSQEALESASESLEDQENSLAEAEENLTRTIEEGDRAVREAAGNRSRAAEELARTEERAAERRADAQARVVEQEREVERAERERSENLARERRTYRQLLDELDRIEEENARELADARDAARRADEDYTDTLEENAERLLSARRAVREAEDEYVVLVEENARREQEALDAISEAEEDRGDVAEEQNRRIEEARKRAAETAEEVKESEEDLAKEREELAERTEDLISAQQAYNQAVLDEPGRQREAGRGAEDAAIRVEDLQSRLAELARERADALAVGDTGRAAELDREYRLAENDLERAREERDRLRAEVERLQNGGVSAELQAARDEVEAAYEARQEQLEAVEAARERVEENERRAEEAVAAIQTARRERDEAIAEAEERVVEQREAYARLLAENERAEATAEQRLADLRGEVTSVLEENAEREEEAARRRREAREEVARVEEENARSLVEGRQRANEQLQRITDVRVQGDERVRSAEEALAQAIEERRRTARDTADEIEDRQDDLDAASQAFRNAEVQRNRDIADGRKDVAKQTKEVARAQDEVAEKAEEAGARLTGSQAALLAAAQGFAAAFKATFRPATDSMNYLLAEIIGRAEETLPYFGRLASETVAGMRGVWEEFLREAESPRQAELFRNFFDQIPTITTLFAGALTDFALGVFNLVSLATPFAERLGVVTGELFERFREWTQDPRTGEQVTKFLQTAWEWGELLVGVVADVATFLYEIGTSPGARMMAENLAELISLLANNPEGFEAALFVIGGFGKALSALLGIIPGLKPALVILGTFFGTLALFGAGNVIASLAFMWALRKAVFALTGIRIPSTFSLLARLIRRIGGAARGSTGSLRRFANVLRNGVRAGVNAARSALRSLPAILRSGVRRGVNGARSAINRLRGILRGGTRRAVNGTRSAINGLRRILRSGVRRGVSGTRSAISGLRGILRGGVNRAVNGVRSALNRLRPILRNAASRIRGWASRAGTWLRPVRNAFRRVFGQGGALRTAVREFITRFFGATVGKLLSRVLFGPAGWIWLLWELKPRIERWGDKLGNWVNNAVEWAFGFRLDWFGPWIKDRFRQLLGPNIYDAVAAVLGWEAEPFLKKAWKWLGETWVGGLAEGWSEKVGEFWERIKTWANEVYEWLRQFWESKSPSRKTMRLGASIMDGLILSAKTGGRVFRDQMARNARDAAEALRRGMGENMRAVQDAAGALSLAASPELSIGGSPVIARIPVTPGGGRDRYPSEGSVARDVGQAVAAANRARTAERQTIVIPIEVGGRRVDEYIVEVVDGAAREARRSGAAIAARYR